MMVTILHILSKDTGEKPANKVKRRPPSGQKLRARDMAGKVIDRMTDPTAHPDDQANRKRRLLKVPKNSARLGSIGQNAKGDPMEASAGL